MVHSPNYTSSNVAELEICSGPSAGRRLPLDTPSKVLGAGAKADLRFEDPGLTELHAMVVLRGGSHWLCDLGSDLGTWVNDQRVEEVELRPGDRLRMGRVQLRYLVPARSLPVPLSPRVLDVGPGRSVQLVGGAQSGYGHLPPAVPIETHPISHAPPARDDEEGMSLAELLARVRMFLDMLRPYRRSIALASVIGALIGVVLYVVAPPPRRASFALGLVEVLADNPVGGPRGGGPGRTSPVEFFRSAELNFRSPALIEKTLAALGEVDAGPERISSVQTRLEFGAVGYNSKTYVGAFTDRDGAAALSFLDAHVKLYLEEEIEKTLKVITGQAAFLEKQLADTERELRKNEWDLLEFKKKNLDGLPEHARQNYELLFELQRQQSANEREVARLAAQKRVQAGRLRDEDALVSSRVETTRPYQTSIVELNRRIAESRARGLGVDHPDMIRMRAEVEELTRLAKESVERGEETEVEKKINPVYTKIKEGLSNLEASESTAIAERDRIAKEVERVRGIVDRLPELESTYAELTRAHDARKQIHARIFEQLETTRLQVELERASATARYDLISPPVLEVASPLKAIALRVGAGLFSGLFIGIALAAFRHLRRGINLARPPAARSLAQTR